ncbi:hypothetical protein Hanom_Chr10g00941091 [Helianthus anomalus]
MALLLQFYLKPYQMLFVLACCQKVFVVQVWFVLVFNSCCHIRRRWGGWLVPGHGSDCRWRKRTLAVRPRPHGFMMVKIDFFQNALTIYKKTDIMFGVAVVYF